MFRGGSLRPAVWNATFSGHRARTGLSENFNSGLVWVPSSEGGSVLPFGRLPNPDEAKMCLSSSYVLDSLANQTAGVHVPCSDPEGGEVYLTLSLQGQVGFSRTKPGSAQLLLLSRDDQPVPGVEPAGILQQVQPASWSSSAPQLPGSAGAQSLGDGEFNRSVSPANPKTASWAAAIGSASTEVSGVDVEGPFVQVDLGPSGPGFDTLVVYCSTTAGVNPATDRPAKVRLVAAAEASGPWSEVLLQGQVPGQAAVIGFSVQSGSAAGLSWSELRCQTLCTARFVRLLVLGSGPGSNAVRITQLKWLKTSESERRAAAGAKFSPTATMQFDSHSPNSKPLLVLTLEQAASRTPGDLSNVVSRPNGLEVLGVRPDGNTVRLFCNSNLRSSNKWVSNVQEKKSSSQMVVQMADHWVVLMAD